MNLIPERAHIMHHIPLPYLPIHNYFISRQQSVWNHHRQASAGLISTASFIDLQLYIEY